MNTLKKLTVVAGNPTYLHGLLRGGDEISPKDVGATSEFCERFDEWLAAYRHPDEAPPTFDRLAYNARGRLLAQELSGLLRGTYWIVYQFELPEKSASGFWKVDEDVFGFDDPIKMPPKKLNKFGLVIRKTVAKPGAGRRKVEWIERIEIDGTPFEPKHCLDYEAIVQSLRNDGEFSLLTCGCSVAECAGIWEGVRVWHRRDLVHWHVTDPEPERHFWFEAKQYRRAVRNALREAAEQLGRRKGGSFPLGHTFFGRKEFDACLKATAL